MPTRKKFRRKRRSIRGGTSESSGSSKQSGFFMNRFAAARGAARGVARGVARGAAHGVKKSRNAVTAAASIKSRKLKRCTKNLTKELTKGRMVTQNGDNNIYFIVDISNDNIELFDGKNNKKVSKQNITPYNYHDILDEILFLLNIISDNKYLIVDNDDKINEYLQKIGNIQSIMNKINEISDIPHILGTTTTIPKATNVKTVSLQQGGGSCVEDIPSPGRLVKYKDDFYYVSSDGTKIMKNGSEHKILFNGDVSPDGVLHDVVSPDDLSPYDYDKVLSSLLSLFKIILEKKYLYDNDNNGNHINKMKNIKQIIDLLTKLK